MSRMEHLNKRIGVEIAQRLGRSPFTAADLAADLGMSEAVLMRRLTAATPFAVHELVQVAKFLNCGLTDLVPAEQRLSA